METILKILPFTALDDAAQWLAFGLNLVYVILAGRGNAWCWFFGFFGTIFQFVVCVDAELKSDAALQVYYALSAVYGWFSWQERKEDGSPLDIVRSPLSMHLKIGLLGALVAIPLGLYWQSAAFRFEDAFLAVFSIITTFLTARKVLESWLYWLVIDFSYALIYFSRDKFLLGILSLIYFVFSIRGFLLWRKSMKTSLVIGH
ncbi:MAG: nicotinamide mononucleotide transporter [Saprospiraceae bacterium]|nr:nicotinamide mononucleotide transporter [Saprospiraceae bacterium]